MHSLQLAHGWMLVCACDMILCHLCHFSDVLSLFSTDAVFPHGLEAADEHHNMAACAHLLADGYSQSKWVAEQLVLRAIERGLPATVYRPGWCA